MTLRKLIFICISFLAISSLSALPAYGQKKKMVATPDTIPFLRGFSVSFDLAGAALLQLNDWGQYEGALRVNLRDKYFPIVELGIGRANHSKDEVTGISYKTTAPYGRIGMDFNLLKNKHQANRFYAGFRYAFTSYKVDITHEDFPDPVWQWDTGFDVRGERCSQHWIEAVLGVDAQVFGPLHLGWSVRYKRRLGGNDGVIGRTWYVPGYGTYGDTRLGGTFNIIIDI